MLIVVLACSDPVFSQLIEREGSVAIWVIDPPEKKYISNSPDKYFQTDPKLVELSSGWGERELAWRGGAEAAARKPVCNLDQNQEPVWSKQRESKLALVNVEGV